MRYNNNNLLFFNHELRLVIEAQKKALEEEVAGLSEKKILNTDFDELKNYFRDKYYLYPLEIKESEIYLDHNEVDVDVRGDPNRFIMDRSRPVYIKGTQVTFHIPFTGDPDLFECRASTYSLNPPEGEIIGDELIATIKTVDKNSEKLRADFDKFIGNIKTNINRINTDIKGFNDTIGTTIVALLNKRKDSLNQTNDFINNLGFPLKQRDDKPETYLVNVQRKIEPVFPKVHEKPQAPDPTIDVKKYDDILKLIKNTALVMERSPKAFKEMGEEDIRTHILVQLNGVYEGQATGETFNNEGKTDILIRHEGKNLFIAECKFWEGEEYFKKGLEQLYGYSAWRDSKLAYLIFNRNKDTTKVLEKIGTVLSSHESVLSVEEYRDNTEFRYKIKHPQDDSKEALLTVMVFDIPK